MRDRLIELVKNAHDEQQYLTSDKSINAIADFLLENGVVVLPCKLGDTMYDISEFVNCVPCPEMYEDNVTFITVMKRKNGEMYFDIECVECDYKDIGKTIFFTKEEAEQALKGGAE